MSRFGSDVLKSATKGASDKNATRGTEEVILLKTLNQS